MIGKEKKVKQWLSRMKLAHKMVLGFLGLIALPFTLLSVFSFASVASHYEHQLAQDGQYMLNMVVSDVNEKMDHVEMLMQVSDNICREYGLSVIEPKPKSERAKPMPDREYRSAIKGESWKIQLEAVISNVMKTSSAKEHFILLKENMDYEFRIRQEICRIINFSISTYFRKITLYLKC